MLQKHCTVGGNWKHVTHPPLTNHSDDYSSPKLQRSRVGAITTAADAFSSLLDVEDLLNFLAIKFVHALSESARVAFRSVGRQNCIQIGKGC